jgi:hypothetical protein
MTKFCSTSDVGRELNVGNDHVRSLIRTNRLKAKRVDGSKGEYLVHPVDVSRLRTIRNLVTERQDPLKPDVVWITEACRFLVNNINASGFSPKLIIGIAFGGLFPASFISSSLKVNLLSLRVLHYNDSSELSRVFIPNPPPCCENIPILVVDDIADSGKTLDAIQMHLLEVGVESRNLRFATLHKKDRSIFTPDWFADVVDGWVQYPWE